MHNTYILDLENIQIMKLKFSNLQPKIFTAITKNNDLQYQFNNKIYNILTKLFICKLFSFYLSFNFECLFEI